MSDHYLEVISLVERLHRQFLGVVKLELDAQSVHDVNNVQALMLFNMGDAEVSVGELVSRGYYLGSNVSYNVKKLSESGYLVYERSAHDGRSIRVRPSASCRSRESERASRGRSVASSRPPSLRGFTRADCSCSPACSPARDCFS